MTRRTQLNNYIDKLYIPVSLREKAAQLRRIVAENDYRSIESKDYGSMHENCLIIETSGRGLRETFAGYKIARVDAGKVGPEMADIAIIENGSNLATPMKVNKKNIRINLLQD